MGERAWDPDPLQPGDRVRLRLSGECPDCPEEMAPLVEGAPATVTACPYGHGAVLRPPDGECYRHVHAPGHVYSVRLDQPVRTPENGWMLGGCLARAELERLV